MRNLWFVGALSLLACGGSTPPPNSTPNPANAANASTSIADAGAVTSPSAAAAYDRVDGATAHELVKGGAQLVDVRSPEEFQSKHIEGAVNVPIESVATHDFGGKNQSIVLYCQAGHRSQKAAEELQSNGYTNVHLLGAMSAWDK